MALLPIPSGLATSNEFESVQGFNALGAPVVVPKTNFSSGGREVLTADRNYYVRTDGNDSNTGLENTAGGAFLTIQKAVDVVCSLDTSIYQVYIYVGSGTYYKTVNFKPTVGAKVPQIIGDSATPQNVVISGTNAPALQTLNGGSWSVEGVTIQASGTGSWDGANVTYGYLRLMNIRIGSCRSGIRLHSQALVNVIGILRVFGNPQIVVNLTNNSTCTFFPTEIICESTPVFNYFASVNSSSAMQVNGSLIVTGTATGARYSVNTNGAIVTFTGNVNLLPGSTAGTTATGGQYA